MGLTQTKRVFIDHYCLNLLNTFLTQEDFRNINIESKKIHIVEANKEISNIDQVSEDIALFIIQPRIEIFNEVFKLNYKLSFISKSIKTNMIFIPGESYEVIEFMKSNDIVGNFKIFSFNMDLMPIDNDLLSLEKETDLRDIYLNSNLSSINELANAFVKVESCFGKVKHKYIKGDYAKIFDDLVQEKEKENELKTNDEILGMIVFDRSVDIITPLTTNYTYEGLVDDCFNINRGTIKVKESLLKENWSDKNGIPNRILTYGLTSSINNFYSIIRCMHYLDANKYINKTLDYYKKVAEADKDKTKKMTLREMADLTTELNVFITQLREPLFINKNFLNEIIGRIDDIDYIQQIKNEQILLTGELPTQLHEYYENYLCDKKDLNTILRLMIIESLTQGGVQDYSSIKRDILNLYGYQKIFIFRDLEKLGWLNERKYLKIDVNYEQICEKLELVNLDYNPNKIQNCSYVTGGYCPISLRLIEKAVEGKWTKIQETLKKMPGYLSFPVDESEISKPSKDLNTIFLVFIGGVTYAEIEGVRFLNRKFKQDFQNSKEKKPTRTQLIIITSGILNHKKIFDNLGKQITTSFTMKDFYEQSKK